MKESKLVEVNGEEEWKVKRILNKQEIRGVTKYLVYWKGFTAKYNIWEREEDLENAKVVVDFKKRMSTKGRRQKKLEVAEEQDFRRGKLPVKYTVKMLYK